MDQSKIIRSNQEALIHLSQLDAVQRICAGLRTTHQLGEVLPILASETMMALDAAAVTIWLYDQSTNDLRQVAGSGFPSLRTHLKPGEGITGQVFATGHPHISSEFKTDPMTSEATRENVPAGLGGAAVPIRAGDEVIGVLFASVLSPRQFSNDQLRLLNIVSDITGVGIHRSLLLAQSERRIERLTALQAIAMAMILSPDLAVTLNILLDQAIAQLNVDAAAILLFNSQSRTLDRVLTRGFAETTEHDHRYLETVAHRVIDEKRAVHFTEAPAVGGFAAGYGAPILIKDQCLGVLEILSHQPFLIQPEWLAFVETLAWHAAIVVENSLRSSEQASVINELEMAVDSLVEGWARAIELREGETEGHTQQLAEMTMRLAQAMNISESDLPHVRRGVLLHDVGNLGLPDSVLFKPSALTQEELGVMRKHPLYAYNLLSPIAQLRPAIEIPYCHHERWDGTGYPHGLAGESIPLAARIFAVIDVWDALRSHRVYRPAWPNPKIIQRIQSLSGTMFDPKVVEKFLAMLDQMVPSAPTPAEHAKTPHSKKD